MIQTPVRIKGGMNGFAALDTNQNLDRMLRSGEGESRMTGGEQKGREFEIAQEAAELLDSLPPEKQRQVMAMLATRYGMKLNEPSAAKPGGYAPRPGKKRSW